MHPTPQTLPNASQELSYWRDFFEELGTTAWIWNLSNDQVEFTNNWLRSIGYEPNEINTGTSWFSLLHPDDASPVSKQTDACIDGALSSLDIEFRIRKKGGGYLWVNSRAKIISSDDANNTKYFFGLYTDITRQQEAKTKLKKDESRWNSALEGSGVGVWELDIRSGSLYWSPELYRIINLDANEINPTLEMWYDLVVPEHREQNRSKLNDYLAGKNKGYRDEHQISCGDGSRKWILTRASVTARSSTGEPLRMTGTLDDISARKAQEQALKNANERVNRVAATIPGFVFEYHLKPDGTQHAPYVSEGIAGIYNLSPEDFRVDTNAVAKAIHPDDVGSVAESIKVSAKSGKPWKLQYRIQLASGEIRTLKGVANRVSPIEPDGTAVFFGYVQDITEELKLARRGEEIAELVPGALFQYQRWPDGRHNFPYATKGMGGFFGVPDATLAENGDIPMQAIHPDDVDILFDNVRKYGEQRVGGDLEYRVIVDNEVRWHRATTNIVEEISADGSITWNGYLNDITEAKADALIIHEQHQLLRKVTTTVPGLICQHIIAPNNSVTIPFLGDDVQEIFGVDKTSVQNNPEILWTYLHPDDKPNVMASMGGGENIDLEYRVLLPKIGERWRRSLGTCVISENGTKTYYQYIFDATESKQNELELQRQSQAVSMANDDLEQFNYVAAHDLKEPLRAIKHLSEWIEEGLPPNLDESVTKNLTRMRARVERLQLLVDDLAAYSRAGRQGYDTSDINLRQLVERVVSDIEHLDCEPDVSGIEDIEIKTVEVALETVFKNLINNAAQHCDAQSSGKIIITAETDEYFITCTVEDDGPGIAPEHHERVFKMYQRLNPEANTTGSGSGLTIIRRIIGTGHGTIELESPISADSRGTRFIFKWPVNWPKNQAN